MTKRILVHLHLYYLKQLDAILNKLQNLRAVNPDFDLYVTMVTESPEAEQKIKTFKADTHIIKLENRGYDVGPFLEVLRSVNLDNYDYVLKIHTKGVEASNYTRINGRRFDNKLWGSLLFDALLESEEQVETDLRKLEKAGTGMLSSAYLVSDDKNLYQQFLPKINKILKSSGLPQTDKFKFVAGTMFWVKAKLLKPLQKYGLADFEVTDGKIKEGTEAHCFERLFGALAEAQGYKVSGVYGINSYKYEWHFMLNGIKRFLFYKKHTKRGKILIKICKIPVWTQKINKD